MATGSVLIDVGIGLAYVYLLLALLCTAISEGIAHIFSLRRESLVRGLRQMLDGKVGQDQSSSTPYADKLLQHGLIAASAITRKIGFRGELVHAPAYISSATFVSALLGILGADDLTKTNDFAAVQKMVSDLPEGYLKSALGALIQEAQGDLNKLRAAIERWFNDSMDRVTGWYKSRAQWITVMIAVMLVIAVNADTVKFVRVMYRDSTVRAAIVKAAESSATVAGGANQSTPKSDALLKEVQALPLPIGWGTVDQEFYTDSSAKDGQSTEPTKLTDKDKQTQDNSSDKKTLDYYKILGKPLGLILSALAVSLGAPFWFDVLNRVMSLRATGKKPEIDEPKSDK